MSGWNAEEYAANAGFVPAYGAEVLTLLAPQPGERILDLGCGDGVLTKRIAEARSEVLGIDSSPEMVAAARRLGLDARQGSGEALDFAGRFDALFTNAALHWMRDQRRVAGNVFRALRPGGRYVGECGGFGNIAAIRTAIRAVLARHGVDPARDDGQYYPTMPAFRAMHADAGFEAVETWSFARPTPLPTGIRGWLQAFRGGFLDSAGVAPGARQAVIDEVEALLAPALCDSGGRWQADYVRLRWRMRKPV